MVAQHEHSHPVLQVASVVKSFGHIQALRGVSLEVNRGEVVALVGDNGAGKSTLIKIVAGVMVPDDGEVRIDGVRQHFGSPQQAARAGVQTVYQDLALADNLDVVASLFLGREIMRGFSLDEVAMEEKAAQVLTTLGVSIRNVRATVAELSGGQRQGVAVARCVLSDSKVIQMDEPTAALGAGQSAQVFRLVQRLQSSGIGVLYVSHNLPSVIDIADRIVVLRLGRQVGIYRRGEVTAQDLVGAITGATASQPGPHQAPVSAGPARGERG